MSKEKYVAYVSSYTMKDKYGIKIYDVDMNNGRLIYKDDVEISNSSYITISHNNRYLYSITDTGVNTFAIGKKGELTLLSSATINGMRGCYISTDYEDKLLFVAGYHDGKITVLRILEDGTAGEITDEKYNKGLGIIAERNFRPHVNCVKMTRDNRYLLAVDVGMDHTDVYEVDHESGTLRHVDVIRSDIDSGPRQIKFSKDGKYLYIVHETKNYVDVYEYKVAGDKPVFDKIQTISTVNDYHASMTAATTIKLSCDYQYVLCANAGDNSVIVYNIEGDTGLLQKVFCLPISGDYPKDASLFPNNKQLVSLNHDSDTMTFFHVDMKKGLLIMNGPEIKVEKPNCIIFQKLEG